MVKAECLKLKAHSYWLPALGSWLLAPGSGLPAQTPDSWLLASDSRLSAENLLDRRSELFQEAHIVLAEEADIIDAVFQ